MSQARASSSLASVVFALYLATLVAAPLWYGGAGPLAQSLFVSLFALLAMATVFVADAPDPAEPAAQALRIPAVCYAAAVAWALFQALAPAPEWLAAPVWRLASDTLGVDFGARVSVSPWRTLGGVALLLGYALVFWTAFRFSRSARLAQRGVATLFYAGAAYAAWALVDHFAGWNRVLFEAKDPYALENLRGFASGTFRNRDHFAAFCGVGYFCGLAIFLRRARGAARRALTDEIEARDALRLGADAACLLCLALAVWLSRSRAAIGLLLVCSIVFVSLAAWRLRSGGRARLAWALTGIIGIVALGAIAAVLESGVAAERVASMGKAWSDRWNIFGLVLGGIGRNVWTGTGLGAFIDAFPLYRGAQAGYGGLWNAAHNIYLESLFGLGLPAFLLLAGAVGWAVARCAVGAARRRRRATAPVAAALASLFLLGHGLVDFSVQTPAVAYAWAALLGFGCAQSWRSRASR